jgi:xanthine dehydrogenase accessory factor
MQEIYQKIVKIISEGGSAALATVVSTEDSTPRNEGAKMLVQANGEIIGSIGGGSVEFQVCQEAEKVIKDGKPKLLHFGLSGEQPTKDAIETGMICGGEMQVYIEPIRSGLNLYLFGGGHISISLCRMGKMLGFHVVVIDDKAEFANKERFPEADVVIVEDFEKIFEKISIDESSYIVIATRGHAFDEVVLQHAAVSGAKYVGMMGSSKKIKALFSHLESRGVPRKLLEETHTPIGLEINAETPEEIAISILAEIVKIKRAPAK